MWDQTFALHPRLEKDCFEIRELPLSRLLLLNDARFPWFLLVPRVEGIREIHHLTRQEQQHLWSESSALAGAMEQAFRPDKLNIAAIGNLVPQLHLHHIARFADDAEWPAPVWGRGEAVAYGEEERRQRVQQLMRHFSLNN